ncbi:hypothetical protein [Chitinophaga sp. Cy-1792]|uniref:hypothetical protein n=1 Tax=Chitinophaga sp. Cy-1792 TaxID=2608339 RepID=UPI00141F7DB0|nr:hypothetical protein [Chitinophaga sp. Cy-1792]NIG56793.1 hypothetical protein [Chitinophaga sp. Cy-1792]
MLNLIKSGKSGRNFQVIEQIEINLKKFFKKSEDSLTSSIFERLLYLPPKIFWEILTKSIADKELYHLEAQLINVEFWPRWDFENGYKEADVFLRFKHFDLIIEAKRNDDEFTQYEYQWISEAEAYIKEYGNEKPCYLLAIGGINKLDTQTKNITTSSGQMKVFKLRWSGIIYEIKTKIREIEAAKEDTYNPVMNILRDLLGWFEVHGFNSGDLLNTLPTNISISQQHLDKFKNSKKLSFLRYSKFPENLQNINLREL